MLNAKTASGFTHQLCSEALDTIVYLIVYLPGKNANSKVCAKCCLT